MGVDCSGCGSGSESGVGNCLQVECFLSLQHFKAACGISGKKDGHLGGKYTTVLESRARHPFSVYGAQGQEF